MLGTASPPEICDVRIMKAIAILLLLAVTAHADQQEYYQVSGRFAQAWEPSSNHVKQALSAVRAHCRIKLSDTVKEAVRLRLAYEVEVIYTNDTISVVYDPPKIDTNSIPEQFKVYGIKYTEYRKNIGAFVESNAGGNIRFIAVQHLLDPKQREEIKKARPFTVYYNVENGKVGLDTASTWERDNDGFGSVAIIYSPGPPYYIYPVGNKKILTND